MQVHRKVLLYVTMVCLVLGGTAVFGQTTTGLLSGVVTAKEDGAGLPGAQITAVHQPTGARYSALTGVDGRFRILNVRAGGPYTVSAAMDGFHTQEATDINVQLGEDTVLQFQLQLSTIEETLVVVGESSSLINPSRSGAGSNVGTEALESLPTVRRSLDEFTRTSPFFNTTSENQDPDAISAGGRNSQYNSITIDGSVNNDLFGLSDGGTPGGQSGTTPISLDAIQEVQLVLSSFDVRDGGFTGGGINAITRSGSNNFAGSVFYYTRDADFFGDGPAVLGGELRGFEEDQYGFRLGGPVSKDKAFFFVNADIEDRASPSGWSIDGSSGQTFAGGNLVNEANIFRDHLINTYGFDPGGVAEQVLDDPSDKYFGRLDFNLNDSNNLTLRHNYVDAFKTINRPGSFTYEFDSEGYDFQTETNSTVAQLNSVISASAFNEARLALQSIKDRRAGSNGTPFPWIEIEDVNGSASGRNEFEAGTEPFSTRNSLDQDILEIHNDFTWIKGDHTITIGTHNELFTFDNLFVQNAFGSYEFASLETFLAGTPREFEFTVINPGQPETQEFDINQVGLYIGDEWTAQPNLTVNFGLRLDIPFIPDAPSRNPFTEETYNGLRTDDVPDGEQLWQPRFGFNWDIENNGQSQLRGGAGIFSGRAPYVWVSNNYARTGIEQSFFQCTNQGLVFNPDPFNQEVQCTNAGGGEFNIIDPDFQLPQVLRFNLGYERQLPWWGLIGSAELIFTDSVEEIDYENRNLTPTGELTFDGRPVYTRIDTSVAGAYFLTNTSDGEATTFALKLERPFRDGVSGFVSYAWTDSEVVNEGTSSRAVSNFRFQEALDPNNNTPSRSDFEIEHSFKASFSYAFNRSTNYPTTVSLFYTLQSGRPYTFLLGSDFVTFGFGQSVNGDGWDSNDLFFVPAGPEDALVTTGARDANGNFVEDGWPLLDAFISSNGFLDAHRGQIMPRNEAFAPWNHSLDLHLAQDIPIGDTSVKVTLDVLNLLNLLDDDSGTVRFVNFGSFELAELEGFADDGRPIYNLSLPSGSLFSTHNINSRWRAKLGVRWSF